MYACSAAAIKPLRESEDSRSPEWLRRAAARTLAREPWDSGDGDRAEVWWADLDPPHGTGPGGTRPVVIVQANRLTHSRLSAVVVVALAPNVRLADAPGNVLLPAGTAGLQRDSVASVTQMLAVDQSRLTERLGALDANKTAEFDRGLRLVLGL